MASFYASQLRREREKYLRKLYDLDVGPLDADSLFYCERLSYGFDLRVSSSYQYRPIKSTWGDDYDIAIYGRLGIHCHNVHKGTNFKFVRWEKFDVKSTAYSNVYVTLEAKDTASESDFSFQTLLSDASFVARSIKWRILACRFKSKEAVDDYWDDKAIDDFYKGAMPKCLSDEELACDNNKKYYVVQESELQENDWLHLFTEIAFYAKTEGVLTAPPHLEIEKVVVQTKEDTAEASEKLKAKNVIFFISYKYTGESSSWARDQKAVIRKTMDGKPEHMCLEVAVD